MLVDWCATTICRNVSRSSHVRFPRLEYEPFASRHMNPSCSAGREEDWAISRIMSLE
jgi:hypothetical protein